MSGGKVGDAALRRVIQRIVTEGGVSQKVLAKRMGVSESWLSRWLEGGQQTRPITLQALQGLQRYLVSFHDHLRDVDELLLESRRQRPKHDVLGHASDGPPDSVESGGADQRADVGRLRRGS